VTSGCHDTGATFPADRLVLATGAAADAARRFAEWDLPQRDFAWRDSGHGTMPRFVKPRLVDAGRAPAPAR
jgi:hypothetical protein